MASEDTLSAPTVESLPTSFSTTRAALHQVAFFAMAPVRYQATGRLGLRAVPGGFGTPPWDTDEGQRRLRMDGDRLVTEVGGEARSMVPSTLQDAVELLGIEYVEDWFAFHDPPAPIGPSAPLSIDPEAADVLARWFGFTTAVLEQLATTPGAVDVSEIQLWPEHFDVALEMGREDAGQRASYGGSPGDADHPEPYLYVAAWGEIERSEPYWNDLAFNGASLSHRELLDAHDPVALAQQFLQRGRSVLEG